MQENVHLVIVFGLLQTFGVFSTLAARLSENSTSQLFGQRMFLASWGLVGAAAACSLCCGAASGYWLSSGFTFSIMALGATLDLRPPQRSASF